jgi:ubiquinol-cytochrome c reductase cytochrome b subunit/menaquinol-cytochrome c reductase cytochrome b/c subunit
VLTILTMAFLTIEGALAGSPTEIEMKVEPRLEEGKAVAASSGCLGCHRIGENGNSGPGPPLTNVGERLPRQAIARTLVNPTAPMPSYSRLRQNEPEQFDQLVEFLSSLREK